MFLSLGGSRRSKARENNTPIPTPTTSVSTQSYGYNALNQAGVDSSRAALLDTLQSSGIGSSLPPLAPPSPDVTSRLSLDPGQSLAGARSRYAPFSRLGASPLPPYCYRHDLATSQNYPSFQPDPRLPSLHGQCYNVLQPSFSSVSPSSGSPAVPSFVPSPGTSSPSLLERSLLCRGDCSPGQSKNFVAHEPRVLQPSARRSQTLDLAKKLKDSLGTKFADSLRETLEGAAKPGRWVPEFSDEASLLKSDGATTWMAQPHPHPLEDGISSRSESTDRGFSGRESWDTGTHWGVEAIGENSNSSPSPSFAFSEAVARSSFEFSNAEVSSWLQSQQQQPQPQPQPSIVAPQDFTSSSAIHGPILAELSAQSFVWPGEQLNTSTTTPIAPVQAFSFESAALAHATRRNNNARDLLRLPSDSGSLSEIINYCGQGGAGVKRGGGDVGVSIPKRPKVCTSGYERADGTGAAFGFDHYLAALAATERAPPSSHELGATSPVSKFLEHFERHEELRTTGSNMVAIEFSSP